MSVFLSSLLFHSILVFLGVAAFNRLPSSHSLPQLQPISFSSRGRYDDRCGQFQQFPFPFHLNASLAANFDAFRLSCLNSTSLFLTIASQSYRVLNFFSDGLLVDFPTDSSCRRYSDLNSFSFEGNAFYGLSIDNVIGLYDCDDSSVCKADCEKILLPGCDQDGNVSSSSSSLSTCCYPLSDHSVWEIGDGFSVFSEFGCRGFSSWAVSRGVNSGKRGIKLEWAIPMNSSDRLCASNAFLVNATTVKAGIRCMCQNGFAGDGFAAGVGCLKSCTKSGQEAYGEDCYIKRHSKKKVIILAGCLTSAFIIASSVSLYALLKRPIRSSSLDHDPADSQGTISFHKVCKTRLFTYRELEEATKGFEYSQKLVDGTNGTIHAGVLGDGSHVAVQKVQCENERDFMLVLSRVEVLSTVAHRNVARILGCCIDSDYTPFIVYEFSANGNLEEHLHQERGQKGCLDWYMRLKIAAETASALAYLQCEISPPIYHRCLKSNCIFLDQDYSVKVAGFGLLNSSIRDGSCLGHNFEGTHFYRGDVYDLGVVLLEIITGSKHVDLPTMALTKIRSGKLEEIVDPLLYYHEQPPCCREQIEIVADLVTRCLLFGGDGRLVMVDVASELVHITKENLDGNNNRRGPALEETFSNSSLLQMISMSPESIYVP
ncbi:probably inactive receptor-like protein kinase At2g46850 isoform X2 [Telopea speciosissima]|uniref:probably inactive receptor-like protein kinase At2g46850 isoform X2 n=1 Tax=Telopea speciosissima TaxID=54955 RepID=UPI001CC71AFF|nr:probably inactive receptor-like protein kinase At2g46850 isoform X2 [Telopea speciosissima]